MNGLVDEYEKRFDKFKLSYEEVVDISSDLRKEYRKADHIRSHLNNISRKISFIEGKIKKTSFVLDEIGKRIHILKEENNNIYDRISNHNTSQSRTIKEINDSINNISAEIKAMKTRQTDFLDKSMMLVFKKEIDDKFGKALASKSRNPNDIRILEKKIDELKKNMKKEKISLSKIIDKLRLPKQRKQLERAESNLPTSE
jgi:predicted RNase H-like nuclease (RuvC/YqgF family)